MGGGRVLARVLRVCVCLCILTRVRVRVRIRACASRVQILERGREPLRALL
jgi:hypothetical protein